MVGPCFLPLMVRFVRGKDLNLGFPFRGNLLGAAQSEKQKKHIQPIMRPKSKEDLVFFQTWGHK